MSFSTFTLLFTLLTVPALMAASKRRVAYEPPMDPPTASIVNLLLNANTTASGQLSDRGPELAVNGVMKVTDHTFMSEQCGFEDARIHGYSMLPWRLSFRYFDEASNAYVDNVLQPDSDEYDAFWGSFLRWAYHSWPENPLTSTDFPIGPSGDCFLIYPGDRSSIRFERLRDGIESFEKIRLLREAAAANPSPEKDASLAKLDAVLADFTWQRGKKSGPHTGDVQRANAAILHATRVICR